MEQKTLIGNLGRDAEVKTFGAESAEYIVMNIATSRKDSQGTEHTKWHSVFLRASESRKNNLMPYLTKGTKIYVQGTPHESIYTTKEGTPQISYSVNADSVEICGSPSASRTQFDPTNPYQTSAMAPARHDAEASDPLSPTTPPPYVPYQ